MADPHQISRREFDEDNDAKRVVIVGGADIKLTAKMDGVEDKLSKLIDIASQPIDFQPLPEVQVIKENVFIDRIVKVEVEKPVYIYETKIERIEIPKVVYETKVEIIEKPIYIDRVVHVDKPLIVKEYSVIELPSTAQPVEKFPNIIKWYLIASQIIMFGLLVVNLIKK